ncbi:uncharacterized protein FIBRA_04853 [Fibroporia radiculosa]|uniref:Uncharacterized protein n=1 Tax=Fibroporia radiculosa TaxID=599839 RepID=J4GPX8_9APHY|nr:uncharacterized protein FIBRA_04853 [Fibroporia radiculosa]CCM02745.1 predicted protein [Fibroporia radiculosa]
MRQAGVGRRGEGGGDRDLGLGEGGRASGGSSFDSFAAPYPISDVIIRYPIYGISHVPRLSPFLFRPPAPACARLLGPAPPRAARWVTRSCHGIWPPPLSPPPSPRWSPEPQLALAGVFFFHCFLFEQTSSTREPNHHVLALAPSFPIASSIPFTCPGPIPDDEMRRPQISPARIAPPRLASRPRLDLPNDTTNLSQPNFARSYCSLRRSARTSIRQTVSVPTARSLACDEQHYDD